MRPAGYLVPFEIKDILDQTEVKVIRVAHDPKNLHHDLHRRRDNDEFKKSSTTKDAISLEKG